MPNRILKESICDSEDIDRLSSFQENFFYRLIVNCDDYGCFDARVKVVASKLFPLRDIRHSEIVKALNTLAEVGLIILYEVEGKPYLKVKKWSDHQRVRVSKHKYPMPEDGTVFDSLPQVAASCGELRQVAANGGKLRPESNPIQSESNPYPNPYPNPNPNPTRAGAEENEIDRLFDLFWKAYPRKESKPAAKNAFKKVKPDQELLEKMIESIERWKTSSQWNEDGGKYIPYPASWLGQRKWEDEIKEFKPQPKTKVVVAQDYDQRSYEGTQEYWENDIRRRIEEKRKQNAD